ncbi:hypothetical protein [Pseudoroseomonas cervicalis]|uniref:hypothetical protein n=1 Tax=Teichococcus cervicalis TaxID=204525 RepID=UPI0022F15E93|nr:hypothetical protein [Pseudoroseomonas cervicalis]WBV45449.1 hypothetical protein PFY06_21460 [Pseudoroseomonas cervicalis]
MSANAMTQDEPPLGEMVALLGWPWKLALGLLLATPLLALLPQTALLAPGASWPLPAALASATVAALLALGSGLQMLRALLGGPPSEGEAAAPELVAGLRGLLEEQRLQMHEATAAVGRAVAAGAQLSGLARAAEKQLRQTLDRAGAAGPEEGPALLASLRQTVSWVDAELGAATARLMTMAERAEKAQPGEATALPLPAALPERLEAVLHRLDAALPQAAFSRLEHCAERLESAAAPAAALPATATALAEGVARLEMAARAVEGAGRALGPLPQSAGLLAEAAATLGSQVSAVLGQGERLAALAERGEALLAEAPTRLAAMPAAEPVSSGEAGGSEALAAQLRSLAGYVDRLLRNEATLGDAARYLTETTDRFAAGTGSLETSALRLQALVSILGQRDAQAELQPVLGALERQVEAASRLGDALDGTQRQLCEMLAAAAEVMTGRGDPAPGGAGG